MLHSKRFSHISDALEFANDFDNKIIPISFVPTEPGILFLIYEAVEIEEPGTNTIDLLKEAKDIFNSIDTFYIENSVNIRRRILLSKINDYLKC